MTTEVEICNLALSNIRSQGINSLAESSLQAQQCKLKYPIMRDMLIREHGWSFTKAVKPLALLSGSTVFNWAYVYQYPSDCITIDRVIINYQLNSPTDGLAPRARFESDYYPPDLGRQVQYKVMNIDGNKVVVSNDADLRIEYRRRETDTTLYDSMFIAALSWLLAAEVALPIVGGEAGRALRSDAMTVYQGYLASAMANDTNEGFTPTPESEFVTVRG